MLTASSASGHHLAPDEVVARLSAEDARDAFDITTVQRQTALPRLLLVRVGPGWTRVYAARRVAAAEEWLQMWRDAVPNGIVGIVDADDRPLVHYDPTGRATLHDPPPVTPAGSP